MIHTYRNTIKLEFKHFEHLVSILSSRLGDKIAYISFSKLKGSYLNCEKILKFVLIYTRILDYRGKINKIETRRISNTHVNVK